MSDVIYYINDVNLNDNGAYVSQSHGLVDALEPKKVVSYDWPEYHGTQYDLGAKPRYKEREIRLDMFFTGDNWQDLVSKFNTVMNEFDKDETQRLMVLPMGYTEMIYDVIRVGVSPLNKTFSNGATVGTSTLRLIEPNPVKVVLKHNAVNSSVGIKYNAVGQTLININGVQTAHMGDVDVQLPTPSEVSYITIAGDIDNLVTNAERLW